MTSVCFEAPWPGRTQIESAQDSARAALYTYISKHIERYHKEYAVLSRFRLHLRISTSLSLRIEEKRNSNDIAASEIGKRRSDTQNNAKWLRPTCEPAFLRFDTKTLPKYHKNRSRAMIKHEFIVKMKSLWKFIFGIPGNGAAASSLSIGWNPLFLSTAVAPWPVPCWSCTQSVTFHCLISQRLLFSFGSYSLLEYPEFLSFAVGSDSADSLLTLLIVSFSIFTGTKMATFSKEIAMNYVDIWDTANTSL